MSCYLIFRDQRKTVFHLLLFLYIPALGCASGSRRKSEQRLHPAGMLTRGLGKKMYGPRRSRLHNAGSRAPQLASHLLDWWRRVPIPRVSLPRPIWCSVTWCARPAARDHWLLPVPIWRRPPAESQHGRCSITRLRGAGCRLPSLTPPLSLPPSLPSIGPLPPSLSSGAPVVIRLASAVVRPLPLA